MRVMTTRKRIANPLIATTILLAIVSTWSLTAMAPRQVFAQYPQAPDSGSVGISAKTLQKCADMGIPRAECSDQTILLKERLKAVGGGSGTSMFAKSSDQMFIFVGALGAIFGGVAAAFLIQSRRANLRESQRVKR